jgi:hypothetical protein
MVIAKWVEHRYTGSVCLCLRLRSANHCFTQQPILVSITTINTTTMATSTPRIEDSPSPTLFSVPATVVLDGAELEIGLQI